jgi:hypothetical protein
MAGPVSLTIDHQRALVTTRTITSYKICCIDEWLISRRLRFSQQWYCGFMSCHEYPAGSSFFGVNPWVGDLAITNTPTQYITQLQGRTQRNLRMLSQYLHNTMIGMNLTKGSYKGLSRLPSVFRWAKITRPYISNARHKVTAPSGRMD